MCGVCGVRASAVIFPRGKRDKRRTMGVLLSNGFVYSNINMNGHKLHAMKVMVN